MAEEAYRNVQGHLEPVDQSLVVSGESGAGKVIQHDLLRNSDATDQRCRYSHCRIAQFPKVHDDYLCEDLRFSLMATALQVLPVCYLLGGCLLSNRPFKLTQIYPVTEIEKLFLSSNYFFTSSSVLSQIEVGI